MVHTHTHTHEKGQLILRTKSLGLVLIISGLTLKSFSFVISSLSSMLVFFCVQRNVPHALGSSEPIMPTVISSFPD